MRRVLLSSAVFFVGVGMVQPGMAQSASGQAQTTASAPKRSAQIQEVVITAEKRKERLSDVATTVDVLSSKTLIKQGVTDISQLNQLVPAVSLNGSTNGRVPYAMRGVSTTASESNVGLESGVGIMVDGVPIPSDSHAAQQIQDIANIQILEGPQATLGGRTASAGVIAMTTRGPKNIWTGEADATFSTNGSKVGSVYVAGPISPSLDFSLSGFGGQTTYPIKNLMTGDHTTQGNVGMRAKLQYKPDALLTATLAGHVGDSVSYGDNFVYTHLTPGSTLLGVPAPFLTPAALLPGVNVNNNNINGDTVAQNIGARIFDRDVSLNVNYQLGNLTLGSLTAYQSESERDVQDLFSVGSFFFNQLTGGHLNFPNSQTQRNHLSQMSQEFKVSSPSTDRLNYIAGVFVSDTNITMNYQRNGLPPATEDIVAHPETTTYDAYGRITYKLTPQFSLTGGLRFNDDELRNSQNQIAFAPYSPQYASAHTNSGALVGDVNAQYHFNTFNMVYFTYARGYAPQAYNTAAALLGNTMSSPVSRMNINHFEIGSKGRYFDGRMTLNADAFYTIYDNYQIQTFAAAPGVLNPPLVLMNAPQAQTHGVEMSSVIRPAINTTLNFSAAYIDATFVNYKNAECWFQSTNTAGSACYSQNGVAYQNVSGKTLPNSPKFKFVANGEQRLPLDSIGYDLVGGATYTYQSSAQMLPDQSPYAVQGAYGLLDLDLGLESQTGRYSATIFVNNVFNKVYYTDMEDFWNTVWGGVPRNETVVGQPGLDAQRYEGIRLSAKF